MPDSNGVVTVKDFAFSVEPKRFKLYTEDPYVFEAPPTLPLGVLEEAAGMASINVRETGVVQKILDFFDMLLVPASAHELRLRATKPTPFPFGAPHLQPVIEWMLESYGLRPTQPSLPSSSGSTADDSMSSTAGAPSEASIPSDFPSTDS